MSVLRFRVYWEEDDQTYRDIELLTGQTFMDFQQAILKSIDFDNKHSAKFYETNEKWQRNGMVFSSEVLSNKKDAPELSMVKTPVSALVHAPDVRFIYVYDPTKEWTFHVELIGVEKEENQNKSYPNVVLKEGLSPAQYGVKGLQKDSLMEIEEKYDLGSEEMAEGFGTEGGDPE